jgi:hypothetical protein
MRRDKIGITKVVASVISAIVALSAALVASGGVGDPTMLVFLLWIISPYALFLLISWIFERFTKAPARHGIACVVAILMFVFSMFAYADTAADSSSTYGLIFIFVPLWLNIGGPAIFGICLLLAWLAKMVSSRSSS